MNILITGGLGFIGSNLVHYLLSKGSKVINLDCMSYNSRAPDVSAESEYIFIQKNLRAKDILEILVKYNIEYVYHLAAQTHVDLSFRNSVHFSQDNVVGTHNLLEAVCKYGKCKRFVHMSTDEVYGDISPLDPPCNESQPYNPSSPYSASKASSDHLVNSWFRTYDFPAVFSN